MTFAFEQETTHMFVTSKNSQPGHTDLESSNCFSLFPLPVQPDNIIQRVYLSSFYEEGGV